MKAMSFGTGVLTGLVAGAVVGMIADPLKDKDSRKVQTHAGTVFKTIGSVIDSMFEK
ncbi:MAG: hypothetical protein WCX81_04325 [Monoglobales bacterium]